MISVKPHDLGELQEVVSDFVESLDENDGGVKISQPPGIINT